MTIRELWDKGYASGSIAIMTGIREREVQKYLNAHGLRRTPTEARAIRKRNNLAFYVAPEEAPRAPRPPRPPRMSLYDCIETKGGLTPEQIAECYK